MLTGFVFYFLIIVPGTAGEMCMSRAMKTVGEVTDFRPGAILRVIGRAMRTPWFWIGLAMMAAGFFSLLGLLSVANVSFVFPATALSYAIGTLGGRVFLRERVTPQRWAGVLLVCIGVTLVFLGTQPNRAAPSPAASSGTASSSAQSARSSTSAAPGFESR